MIGCTLGRVGVETLENKHAPNALSQLRGFDVTQDCNATSGTRNDPDDQS